MGNHAEKTNTGEGDKGKRVRTTSDDAGGKSVSEKSKSVGGKCVSEISTGGKSGEIPSSGKGTGRLVREQIGNVETRIQDSMVFHTEYGIIFDEDPRKHSAVLCARENDGC